LPVYQLDPLTDSRWPALLSRHPRASVFHTPGWLQALRRTYGYEPIAFTTSHPNAELQNGVVCCAVKSWLTGSRLVSLPFADHCDPLVKDGEELRELLTELGQSFSRGRLKYVEIRPREAFTPAPAVVAGLQEAESFCLHEIVLEQAAQALFGSFHKDCIQRKVHRAEREGLLYRQGRSETLLEHFYQLLLRTRRRHQLPPQPFAWFSNLAREMGEALTVRVAYQADRPLASLLTLSFKDTIVYKYGCSDQRFSSLGGTPLLFWKTIQEAKAAGMTRFDLGRSDQDNPGLVTFKDRLGGKRTHLQYYRLSAKRFDAARQANAVSHFAKRVLSCLPDTLLVASGRLLYRHMG
jgi:CelD/BcsL family acetyltransferase involved in cellulose biosynthesis